jgi:hypothetical protein
MPTLREESTQRAFLKQQSTAVAHAHEANEADARVWPYMYFFQCLSDREWTMQKIFEMIATADEAKQTTSSKLTSKLKTSTDLNEIWDEIRLESEAISHEETRDMFAGTLFIMLNSLLRSMANQIQMLGGDKPPTSAGRLIGGASLFELLAAAGNNFRHYEQWQGSPAGDKQLAKNVAVLQSAGLTAPWNRNMCGEILQLIGWLNKAEVSAEMRGLASEIFRHQTSLPL